VYLEVCVTFFHISSDFHWDIRMFEKDSSLQFSHLPNAFFFFHKTLHPSLLLCLCSFLVGKITITWKDDNGNADSFVKNWGQIQSFTRLRRIEYFRLQNHLQYLRYFIHFNILNPINSFITKE
jgi:hypothetical protein